MNVFTELAHWLTKYQKSKCLRFNFSNKKLYDFVSTAKKKKPCLYMGSSSTVIFLCLSEMLVNRKKYFHVNESSCRCSALTLSSCLISFSGCVCRNQMLSRFGFCAGLQGQWFVVFIPDFTKVVDILCWQRLG